MDSTRILDFMKEQCPQQVSKRFGDNHCNSLTISK